MRDQLIGFKLVGFHFFCYSYSPSCWMQRATIACAAARFYCRLGSGLAPCEVVLVTQLSVGCRVVCVWGRVLGDGIDVASELLLSSSSLRIAS